MSVTLMSVTQRLATRRNFMRGMLGGAAINVALPFLDCFLNANGTALASGAPLPVRFGTWFWGCGASGKLSVVVCADAKDAKTRTRTLAKRIRLGLRNEFQIERLTINKDAK